MPDTTPEWAAKAAREVLANARGKDKCDFCGKPSNDEIAAIITRCAEDERQRIIDFVRAKRDEMERQRKLANNLVSIYGLGGRAVAYDDILCFLISKEAAPCRE